MKTFDRCIATSSDAEYFPALMALLRSLKKTNPDIPIIVFDGGLKKTHVKRASRLAKVIKKTSFIDLEGRGKFRYIGKTTLLKFEVTDLKYDKVLYLDVDMVVLESLDSLFDLPRGKIGAVREVNRLKNMFRMKDRKRMMSSLHADWEAPGFNAGLFVIRPQEWRDLKERAMRLIDRFGEDVFSKTKDQQLLNIIFRNNIHNIPGRYNFSPFYDEGACDPAIIHYLSNIKPWRREYPQGCRYAEFRQNISVVDFPAISMVDALRKARKISGEFSYFIQNLFREEHKKEACLTNPAPQVQEQDK